MILSLGTRQTLSHAVLKIDLLLAVLILRVRSSPLLTRVQANFKRRFAKHRIITLSIRQLLL